MKTTLSILPDATPDEQHRPSFFCKNAASCEDTIHQHRSMKSGAFILEVGGVLGAAMARYTQACQRCGHRIYAAAGATVG